jgi:diacylglycerol O-acyltransferase
MTGLETLMWRLGQYHPGWRPTMSLVVTLDGPLRRADLMARLARLCLAVPRLRQKVREPLLPSAPPAWEDDPAFALENHVTEEPGALWAAVGRIVAAPLPCRRPPWRAVMVGRDPGVLVLHLHHSYTDGQGGLRLVAELFDLAPGGPGSEETHSDVPLFPPPRPVSPSPGWRSVLGDVGHEAARSWSLMARAGPWAARTLAAGAWRPEALMADTGAIMSSIRVHAWAALGPASPVLIPRSPEVIVAPLPLDLDPMRTTARQLGVTVNDVFLSGLLDGLGRYHAEHGSFPPSLRVGLPISHRSSVEELRNQFFTAVIRGPLGRLDFAERARLIHEIVLHGRDQPWIDLVEEAAGVAVRLPRMVAVVAAAMGSPAPMWLGRSRVESMVPVGPRSGAAINATLLSYCSTASIGLNLDPVAVPDPEVLIDCLSAAFEDGLGG